MTAEFTKVRARDESLVVARHVDDLMLFDGAVVFGVKKTRLFPKQDSIGVAIDATLPALSEKGPIVIATPDVQVGDWTSYLFDGSEGGFKQTWRDVLSKRPVPRWPF